MSRFVITPHFRLHEWVAEEKGYFRDEGLDYEFRGVFATHATPDKVGAMTTYEKGRDTNVSCACHWTVNVAASQGLSKMITDCYSVAPGGIFVPADSKVREPKDLAGVPISVGHQSGSHYATIQALEQFLPRNEIKLSFADGILFGRMEKLIDGQIPACTLFSGPYYFAEQMGFRKVLDCTFMIAASLNGDPDPEDVRRYFRALRRAQRDIDLRPELYTKHYKNEFPERFHAQMDTRRWGPGERIVFEPYTREIYEESFRWIAAREIFEPGKMGAGDYDQACVSLNSMKGADERLPA